MMLRLLQNTSLQHFHMKPDTFESVEMCFCSTRQWRIYIFISEGADYIFGLLWGKEVGDTLFGQNLIEYYKTFQLSSHYQSNEKLNHISMHCNIKKS